MFQYVIKLLKTREIPLLINMKYTSAVSQFIRRGPGCMFMADGEKVGAAVQAAAQAAAAQGSCRCCQFPQ